MDRLARSLVDLLAIVQDLGSRGISIQFLKEGRTYGDKANPNDTLMLQLLGSFAEYERSIIRERQAEGIAKAKEKGGVYKGGKPRHTAAERAVIVAKAMGPFAHRAAIAREHGISRQTLYTYLREAGQDHDGAMAGSGPFDPEQDTETQSRAAAKAQAAAVAAAEVTAQAIKAARKTTRKAAKAAK